MINTIVTLSLGACTFRTIILHQWPLRTIYDILSLTNTTLLTADTILCCTKNRLPNWWFSLPFPLKKLKSPVLTVPPLSHLTSCTSTKSNLYLANSLATAVNEPTLFRLQTFQVTNLKSLFRCLGLTKVSVQVRSFICEYFVTRYVLTGRSS